MEMVLVRFHEFNPEVKEFCTKVAAESGREVACVVDETSRTIDIGRFRKISFSKTAVKDLGLFRPADAAWRCGDYGLYLAHKQFPKATAFWLLEHDLLFNLDVSLGDFFDRYNDTDADLLATFVEEKGVSWWWYPAMKAGDNAVWGCFFPLVRVAVPLLDLGLAVRRRHSASPIYRLFWPNDEVFLATVAARAGMGLRDLATSPTLRPYTTESFSFDRRWTREDFDTRPPDGLVYHPVRDRRHDLEGDRRRTPRRRFSEAGKSLRNALSPFLKA